MATLVIADHDNNRPGRAMPSLVAAARHLGDAVTILVAGHSCRGVAEALAAFEGVERVLLADAPHLAYQLAEPVSALVMSMSDKFEGIVALANARGKDLMPRVAALLDVMQISEVVEIKASDTFVRPTYAGNAYETLHSRDATKVLTVRASAFEPVGEAGGAAEIMPVDVPGDPGLSRVVGQQLSQSDRPELESARIVVSGGRAFGSRENFERYLEPLAVKLGAAIGASRVAVDSGYAPNELQVGQTGKIVSPELYIACGISGAIQHLAGMKDSRCIVAINKDPQAPIFQIADYWLVGDIFEILPELTEKL